jgi:hypothetical protein
MAHAQLPDHYAESTMLFALSADGQREISLRLARFPLTGQATVWLHVADGKQGWSMAHEQFNTSLQATPIDNDAADFAAHYGDQSVKFVSQHRYGQQMRGQLTAELRAVAGRHPKLGEGNLPVYVDLRYTSVSAGFRAASGRWEMTGYGMFNGELYELQTFEIQGPQAIPRRFKAGLYDPRTDTQRFLKGQARAVQEWSVPIEGRRRPGAAVIVDASEGAMFGSLNDWQPAP